MARFRWTDEVVAELRRQMNLETTYAGIGKMLGVSEIAVRSKVFRLGWGSHGHSSFKAHRRMKGKPKSAAFVANLVEHSRRRWRDPAMRERMLAHLTDPTLKAKRLRAVRAVYDARRGFAVSAEHADEFRRLTQNKGLTAHEAGRILGLIPQTERSA